MPTSTPDATTALLEALRISGAGSADAAAAAEVEPAAGETPVVREPAAGREPVTGSQQGSTAAPADHTTDEPAVIEAATARDALAEVARRFGPDACISDARKVTRGGIGGFFAKEVVRVTVDAAGRATTAGAAAPPVGQAGTAVVDPPDAARLTSATPPAAAPTLTTARRGGGAAGDTDAVAAALAALRQREDAGERTFADVLRERMATEAPATAVTPGAEPSPAASPASSTAPGSIVLPPSPPPASIVLPDSPAPAAVVLPTSPAPAPVARTTPATASIVLPPAPAPAPVSPAPVSTALPTPPPASDAPERLAPPAPLPVPPGDAGHDVRSEQPATAVSSSTGVALPRLDRGARWDPTNLRRLGLPALVVDAVAGLDPHDDAACLSAVAGALSTLCRPLPYGDTLFAGPRVRRLATALRVPMSKVGETPPVRGDLAVAARGTARSRGWLAWARADRYLHVVVGGEGWRPLLFDEPLAVSWADPDDTGDAVRIAAETGLVLGYGPGSDRRIRRADPLDVALGVREALGAA